MRNKYVSRENHLLAEYNLTLDDFARMQAAQDGKCKLCLRTAYRLVVDHDHVTGNVRGLLCDTCNRMLGQAKDNQVTLLRAIQYLKGKL